MDRFTQQTDTQTGRHTYSRTDRQTGVQESCRQQKGGEGVGGLSAISNIILKQKFASPDPLPFFHKPTSGDLSVCVALISFYFHSTTRDHNCITGCQYKCGGGSLTAHVFNFSYPKYLPRTHVFNRLPW